MSPNLRIDPESVRSLARTVERAADDTTGISTTIGTAQRDSALIADGPTRLGIIDETLSLVARTLVLRADLAEVFTIDLSRFRLAEELSMVEFELGALLAGPARAQADRLIAALDAAGALHPGSYFEPDGLDAAVAQEPEVAAVLAELATHRDDPAYLADFFARLGPERTTQLVELTNAIGYAVDHGQLRADAYTDVLQPLAVTLSAAERAGALDPAITRALLDLGPGDPQDPRYERLSVTEQEEAEGRADVRRRILALLLQEGQFSSAFRAEAASLVVRSGPTPWMWSHEGFHGGRPDLALTDVVALRSLLRDDDAMHLFVTTDADGDGWYENAYILTQASFLYERDLDNAAHWTGDRGVVRDELLDVASTVLERGLLAQPLANGTSYSADEIGAFSTVVVAASWGDVDDRLKRSVAAVSAPYVRDLAAAYRPAERHVLEGETRLVGVTPETVAKFMQELSYDQDALARMAANGSAFMIDEMKTQIPRYVAGDQTAFDSEGRGAGVYFAALGDGIDRADIEKEAAREALVNGMRMVSDPLLGLAVGKIPGAGLPVVSGVAGKATDSLSDAIYGKLVPMPELEDLQAWRDGITEQTERVIIDMAWNDPALRVELGGPTDQELRDLELADPVVAAAVRQNFAYSDQMADFLTNHDMAINAPIIENKTFAWLSAK